MDADLQPVYNRIMQAEHPEDLFGSRSVILPPSTLLEYLAKEYDALKAVTPPSLYGALEDVEAARDADAKLDRLYATGKDRIKRQVYGIEGANKIRPSYASKSFKVGENTYFIGAKLFTSEHANGYEGFLERDGKSIGEVVIKVAIDVSHNPHLQNEARNLDAMHAIDAPQWKHLPLLLDRFSSANRIGLVHRKIVGFSLSDVRVHRVHKNGVDAKHIAWMFDRAFSCLGFVHGMGLVHGGINPDTIIVQPPNHNVFLVGWSGAALKPAQTEEKVTAPVTDYTAPEVRAAGQIGPWSDIYSLGKTMIYALGGDPTTGELPDSVPDAYKKFLAELTAADQFARPAKAWDLHTEHCRIKDATFGARKFVHFDMS
jgi:Serine/threonine protein kinase